jgi:hypothetical protein
MRRIRLSKGKYSTVDDEFHDALVADKWHIDAYGYAVRNIRLPNGKQTTLQMHRAVMRLAGIELPPGCQIDHKNGRRADNRLCNLRLATQSQQNMNSRRQSNNTSGAKGVSWCKREQKWRAYIKLNGKLKHLSYFDSKHKAAAAYRQAAKKYFGEFARAE